MEWRMLKEGTLFNQHYEIRRGAKGYRCDALNPRRLIGFADAPKDAKVLCELHFATYPPLKEVLH